jgi:hypothetical protein
MIGGLAERGNNKMKTKIKFLIKPDQRPSCGQRESVRSPEECMPGDV